MVTIRKKAEGFPLISLFKNLFVFTYACMVAFRIIHNENDLVFAIFIILTALVHSTIRFIQFNNVWNQLNIRTVEYIKRDKINTNVEFLTMAVWLLLYIQGIQIFGFNNINFVLLNFLILIVSIGVIGDAYLTGKNSIITSTCLFAPSITFIFYHSYVNLSSPDFYIIVTCIFISILAFYVSMEISKYMKKEDVLKHSYKSEKQTTDALKNLHQHSIDSANNLIADFYADIKSSQSETNNLVDLIKTYNDKFDFDFDYPNDSISVHCPKEFLDYSINAILQNAKEAMSNSEEKKLTIKLQEKDNENIILISNNGLEIDESTYDNIFEHGYSTKDGHKGLKLTIARSLIRSIQGNIKIVKVDDMLNTTFEISIPK